MRALRRTNGARGLFHFVVLFPYSDWGLAIPASAGGATFMTLKHHRVAIYVDKPSQQWIVRDPEGNFWVVPAVEEAWENRRPFTPSEDCELEPVPGHYKYMLGLPF
jgi:hypothetical protein